MLSIRKADIDDVPLIHQMAQIVFPATYCALLSSAQIEYMLDWMYSVANLEKQLLEEKHVYFISYKNNEPCGYISIEQFNEDLFHLQKIYVLPKFQGHHIGSFLFREAIKYIKEIHPASCSMELHVNRDNKAVAFYQRMGMKILRQGDFEIGNGYYMNDYIMGIEI